MGSLPPITIGMVGLSFALWANALFLMGVDAEPATVGAPSPVKAVAAVGSTIGAITLTFMSLFLVIAAPLGSDATSAKVQLLFSAISGMYGLQFLGLAIVQFKDFDLRVFGNIALLGVPLQILEMILLASYANDAGMSTTHLLAQEAVLLSFTALGLGIWLGTHGKIALRYVGMLALVALLGTWYFLFVSGGLVAAP
jgi:hypothetical protein